MYKKVTAFYWYFNRFCAVRFRQNKRLFDVNTRDSSADGDRSNLSSTPRCKQGAGRATAPPKL